MRSHGPAERWPWRADAFQAPVSQATRCDRAGRVGGDRGRRAGGETADTARGRAVRRPRRRDDRQRTVPGPRDRRRAVHPRWTAVLLRHTRRLPCANQPVRAQAPSHRSLDADRRPGVQRRATWISSFRARGGARRAQPRYLRHLARGARPGEPAGASDHRHHGAGAARARAAQRPDSRVGSAGRGAGPRCHAGPRGARRRPRDGDGFSRLDSAGARTAGVGDGRRCPRRASAAHGRPNGA